MRLHPTVMLVLLLFDVKNKSIEWKSSLIRTGGGHYSIIVQLIPDEKC